jgi:hypothetical protein
MLDQNFFLSIEDKYIRALGLAIEGNVYKSRLNNEISQITFYHVIWESNLESFKSLVKDANQEILKYVQSNFFYKIIQLTDGTNDKFKEHEMTIYINRIQFAEIEKSPKSAHLATLKNLKDFYV